MLETSRLRLRPYRPADAPDLAREANDLRVWRTLRDRFPHPYRELDAERWIATHAQVEPPTALAIARRADDRLIGGIGVERQADVVRFTGEVGYWLGFAHWGRGLAREAVAEFVAYCFARFDFERLEAWVFEPHRASRRVLEASGFRLEGTARRSVVKQGELMDSCLYGLVRSDLRAAELPCPP